MYEPIKDGIGKRGFAEPPIHPIRLNLRELLAIPTRRTLVGAALDLGMGQNIVATDLVVPGIDAIGCCLRFRG